MPEHDEPCVPCPFAGRVEALERAADAEHQARSRTHEKIYDRLRELERNLSVVSTQYAQIISQLSALSADIAALKDKPAKRWDTVIAAAISALVGFALAKLGVQ